MRKVCVCVCVCVYMRACIKVLSSGSKPRQLYTLMYAITTFK